MKNKKIEMEEINSISFSYCWDTEEQTFKISDCRNNIIFEYFTNDKLEQKKEIPQEEWNIFLNKVIMVLNKRKYSWNNHYSIGIRFIKDRNPPKIKIINKNGEYIEIAIKGGLAYRFSRHYIYFEMIIASFFTIYHEKGGSYKKIDFRAE
jgi:hypothetical protein